MYLSPPSRTANGLLPITVPATRDGVSEFDDVYKELPSGRIGAVGSSFVARRDCEMAPNETQAESENNMPVQSTAQRVCMIKPINEKQSNDEEDDMYANRTQIAPQVWKIRHLN